MCKYKEYLCEVSYSVTLSLSLSPSPSLILQEKPLSRSLQRGEDAQFDQVSKARVVTSRWGEKNLEMYRIMGV